MDRPIKKRFLEFELEKLPNDLVAPIVTTQVILNMDETFQPTKKNSKRKREKVSNLHHFQVELFYEVIDR